MTKTELTELIRNGENSGVEFKRDTAQNFDLAKELVAFSNSDGGHVLLGIDDDGSVLGLTRSDTEEWVMTACRTKIRPEIIPYFEIVRDIEPGKDIAIVSVEKGWTVHCQWHDNHSSYYIRVGSQSREASKEELERLFQRRGAFRLEVRPVSGSSIDDLGMRRLNDYFRRVRRQDAPDSDDMPAWQQLLVNTEIMSNEGEKIVCTVAGLLLFGRNPNRYLPQAGIDAVAYPSVDKEYASLERMAIRGPSVGLFTEKGDQLIEDVMRDYGYLEHMGMGIPRKIIKGMREHNGTEPDLIEDGERFILRLWKEKRL